jgi:hypothetical protein
MNLPIVRVEIEGVTYDHTFNDDVKIDPTNLDNEFCTQAEKYAFYSFIAAEARASMERKKLASEQIYAALDHKKRTEHEILKGKDPKHKYTEKMIENEVVTDPDYKKAKLALIDAKLLAEQLNSAAAAIAQRKDMLNQLGLGHRTVSASASDRAQESLKASAKEVIRQNRQGTSSSDNGTSPPSRRRRPRSA